jgi:FG-GAP-like repeat
MVERTCRRFLIVVIAILIPMSADAATFTVTATADSGAGSLRQAILDANANAGTDQIHFSVGTGAQTLTVTSDLPAVTGPVTIDGTTQPGYGGTNLIRIDASNDTLKLDVQAGGSTIRGLDFTRLQVHLTTNGGNLVVGNYFEGVREPVCALNVNSNSNTVGGTTAADRNRFLFNDSGLCVNGSSNTIMGNHIIEAKGIGVIVTGTGNTIGGTAAGAGNVISFNRFAGLSLAGSQHVVKGNLIGVGPDGVTPQGNGLGPGQAAVLISGSSMTIGGTEPGAGNIIANQYFGPAVMLTSPTATGNAILSNSIYGNQGLSDNVKAISLINTGAAVLNDLQDADSGANLLQNHPVICTVTQSGGNIIVAGRLHSTPNASFTIQIFATPQGESCQARTFLGSVNVNTDANGDAAINATVPGSAADQISATATDASNNTSQVSPCTRCQSSSDFNGDGKSDIFWRNTTTGENTLWFMNSRTVIGGGNIPHAPTGWVPYLGDFNGDGRTDIFWRNPTTGGTGVWYVNGTSISGGGNIPSMAAAYEPLTGDFTGDGRADLLWRDASTGTQELWAARNGLGFDVNPVVLSTAPGSWERRAGYLNAGVTEDMLLRYPADGTISLWFMNGASRAGEASLPPVPSPWTLSLGDSTSDGQVDILWRNGSTGELTFWFLNAGTIIGGGNIPPVGAPWLLARGDFDGNGTLDILWRSPVPGENTLWLLSGRTIVGGGNIPAVPGADWIVIGNH